MFKARKKKADEKLIITINIDGEIVEFNLSQPTFDVKAKAIEALVDTGGTMHMIKSGQIVFDACYTGDLMEVKNDEDVYISVCLKAAELVKIYEGDLKKN